MSPPPSASSAYRTPLEGPLGAAGLVVTEQDLLHARRQAFAAVLIAALCLAFTAIFVRLADVGPAAIGFWRLLFALGPTLLWAYAEHRGGGAARRAGRRLLPKVSRAQALFAGVAGLLFAVDLVLFHAGLARTSTANAMLLGNLTPSFVVLLGWLVLGERPAMSLLGGLALAVIGASIIVGASSAGAGGATGFLGDLLCIGAVAAYAAYVLVVRVVRRGHGDMPMGGGMVALLSTAAGMMFCLAWAVATGEQLAPASLQGFLAVAGLGIVSHALGQGLTTFALGRLPAGVVAVVLLVQVVLSIALAALFFGEIPTWMVVAGGTLTVFGVMTARPR